jgi:hypothetical protein
MINHHGWLRGTVMLSVWALPGCHGDAQADPGEIGSRPPPVRADLPGTAIASGNDTAPVLIIELGSITCRFCREFHVRVLPLVVDSLVGAGIVRYEYYELVRSAELAVLAGAMECVAARHGAIGAKNAAHAALMAAGGLDDVISGMSEYSGIAEAELHTCAKRPEAHARHEDAAESARKLGVTGTPTFLVGYAGGDGAFVGWPHVGLMEFQLLAEWVRDVQQRRGRASRSIGHFKRRTTGRPQP